MAYLALFLSLAAIGTTSPIDGDVVSKLENGIFMPGPEVSVSDAITLNPPGHTLPKSRGTTEGRTLEDMLGIGSSSKKQRDLAIRSASFGQSLSLRAGFGGPGMTIQLAVPACDGTPIEKYWPSDDGNPSNTTYAQMAADLAKADAPAMGRALRQGVFNFAQSYVESINKWYNFPGDSPTAPPAEGKNYANFFGTFDHVYLGMNLFGYDGVNPTRYSIAQLGALEGQTSTSPMAIGTVVMIIIGAIVASLSYFVDKASERLINASNVAVAWIVISSLRNLHNLAIVTIQSQQTDPNAVTKHDIPSRGDLDIALSNLYTGLLGTQSSYFWTRPALQKYVSDPNAPWCLS